MAEKGKFSLDGYVDVAERLTELREKHPEASVQPADPGRPYRIEEIGGQTFVVVVAACYRTPDDPRPGVGMAWEPFPGKTPYTKDSELQNAETSAWGRAIVAALAADTRRGVSSAQEVRNRQDTRQDTQPDAQVLLDKEAIDALMARVEALPAGIDETFRFWKADQRFPWPWPRAAVEAMNAKIDELETARPYEMPDPPGDGVETCVACGKPFKKSGQDARSSSDEKYHEACAPI